MSAADQQGGWLPLWWLATLGVSNTSTALWWRAGEALRLDLVELFRPKRTILVCFPIGTDFLCYWSR